MATDTPIILVHGACHRADCWRLLLDELRASGQTAVAVDLPGFGRDVTADPAPKSLTDGIEAAARAISSFERPIILVGHSLGGMTISGVAERMPEAIARLVYLAAVVPEDGQSTEAFARDPGMKAGTGAYALEDGGRIAFHAGMARDIFYTDCEEAVASAAAAALVPTDTGYLTTPVRLSPSRFGRVPKSYILCTGDKAIDPESQRIFSRRHRGMDVHEIAAGHSPFLSKPAELAAMLTGLGSNDRL